jgi:hypothetical protein
MRNVSMFDIDLIENVILAVAMFGMVAWTFTRHGEGMGRRFRRTVESGCDAVALDRACLFPPLSSSGALVARP